MILITIPGASSLASHIALVWAGAEYTVNRVTRDTVRGMAYRRINPKAVVPALILDDGAALTESLAILPYIAERYPDAALGAKPDDVLGRARMLEALAELVTDIHAAWAPVMAPERYVMTGESEVGARGAAFLQLHMHYKQLDELMADKTWILFDRRTVVDAYLYVMCSWQARTPRPLTDYPALFAYKTRLDADPGIQRALVEERRHELIEPLGVIPTQVLRA